MTRKQTFNADITVTVEREKPIDEDEAEKQIRDMIDSGTEMNANLVQRVREVKI